MQIMAGNSTLSAKQKRFIAALLLARTISEAAKLAGVGERTAHTWLNEPEFKAALNEAEAEALNAASRRLTGALSAAIDRLVALTSDPDAPHSVQLRAATAILEQMFKLKETLDFEARLSALESEAAK